MVAFVDEPSTATVDDCDDLRRRRPHADLFVRRARRRARAPPTGIQAALIVLAIASNSVAASAHRILRVLIGAMIVPIVALLGSRLAAGEPE